MNLSRDYDWYYIDTFIGFKSSDGNIYPYYIESVDFIGDYDDFDDPCNDHNNEDYIEFSGKVWYKCSLNEDEGCFEEDYDQVEVTVNDSRLIYDMPKLGFINNRWLSYRPQRSVKKGLCGMRINHTLSIQDAIRIYANMQKKHEFNIKDGSIMFKYNKVVGKMIDGKPVLFPKAEYLQRRLEKYLDETQTNNARTGSNG